MYLDITYNRCHVSFTLKHLHKLTKSHIQTTIFIPHDVDIKGRHFLLKAKVNISHLPNVVAAVTRRLSSSGKTEYYFTLSCSLCSLSKIAKFQATCNVLFNKMWDIIFWEVFNYCTEFTLVFWSRLFVFCFAVSVLSLLFYGLLFVPWTDFILLSRIDLMIFCVLFKI